MDTSNRSKPHNGHSKDLHPQRHEEMEESAHSVLNEGKKIASSIYKQGMDTLGEAQTTVRDYSITIWTQANKHPVLATVILGGVLGALGALLFVMKKK
jgi:hypothetical protein